MQKYKIVKSMGDGSFGVVFKAIAPNNQIVAIKKMKSKYKSWEQCNNLKQIKCLKKLQHPNLIKLKQVILASNELFLVFDFLQTNLYQMYTRAKESNRTLTQNEIKSIFFKITSGLAYLHKYGFFHRDLKPENILCHNNDVKLCDFGLAREIRSRPPFTEYVSTRWYRAPELLLRGSYNSPVDIFALACIIIELYQMSPLFPGQNEVQTMNKIVELLGTPKKSDWPQGYKLASTINYNFPEKKKKELSDIIPQASPEAIDLLQSMLNYSPRKRPSASEILKHQFFKSINYSNQDKLVDEKHETKFSFYEKNVIQIPTNVPVQDNKEMQMRKSQIKFGASSFTSSFHLSKQEKAQRKKEKKQSTNDLEFIAQSPKQDKKSSMIPHKPNKYLQPSKQHDQITKKFDEMQQILLQLQMKKEKEEKKHEIQDRTHSQMKKYDAPSYQTEQTKMPLFTFGGIGVHSLSNLNSMKNIKVPVLNKSSNPGGKFN